MRILFGWEMGAGMGHLSIHRDLFRALKERGHEIHIVSRSVAKAARAFAGLDFTIWQAPYDAVKAEPYHRQTPTMAYVLHNAGLSKLQNVLAQSRAWDHIIAAVSPELVLVDAAPTLQLALRGKALPVALLSTGYFVPPPLESLPLYSIVQDDAVSGMRTAERIILSSLNAVLATRGQARLSSVAALYNEEVVPLLTTYDVLDHFSERKAGVYVGTSPSPPGLEPEWPEGEGHRVYAYLKSSPWVENVLADIKALGWPTLIVSDGLKPELLKKYASARLRFYSKGLDLVQVAQSCQVAITNANHGTCSQLLLAGVPLLLLPLFLEQQLFAQRVESTGAGIVIEGRRIGEVSASLRRLIDDENYARAARKFAARQKALAPKTYVSRVIEHLAALCPGV